MPAPKLTPRQFQALRQFAGGPYDLRPAEVDQEALEALEVSGSLRVVATNGRLFLAELTPVGRGLLKDASLS